MPMLRVFDDHLMYFLHFQTFFIGEKTSSECENDVTIGILTL